MRGACMLLAVAAHCAPNATSPLSKLQRLSTPRWASRLDPAASFVVQIGANDHSPRAKHDPIPHLVARGWRSILIEPIPSTYARLRANYATTTRTTLRIVNAAVCPRCDMPSPRMYFVDVTSNASHGSSDHDVRCTNQSGTRWISEIASFSARHLLLHERFFAKMPKKCGICARALGTSLRQSCMRRLISKNLASISVPCFCLRSELAAEPSVALLAIDAEGHDLDVLRSYPFDVPRLRPWRVFFEAAHMSRATYRNASELMAAHGYAHVWGGRVEADTWHLIASAEPSGAFEVAGRTSRRRT